MCDHRGGVLFSTGYIFFFKHNEDTAEKFEPANLFGEGFIAHE